MKYCKFWAVWNPNGEVPMFQHNSHSSAVAEAERLARISSGESFYVLEALSVTRKTDVVTETLDDLPF